MYRDQLHPEDFAPATQKCCLIQFSQPRSATYDVDTPQRPEKFTRFTYAALRIFSDTPGKEIGRLMVLSDLLLGKRPASQELVPMKKLLRRNRIVLADDHLDLLHEVRALLIPSFEILQSVTDGLALIDAVRAAKPDVVIADIRMPRINGIEACRRIIQQGLCDAAILLTMYNDQQFVREALEAGIRGYVLKLDAGEELIPAVNSVLRGSRYLSRGVSGGRI
jgi:CheY-like chemotaxis protein